MRPVPDARLPAWTVIDEPTPGVGACLGALGLELHPAITPQSAKPDRTTKWRCISDPGYAVRLEEVPHAVSRQPGGAMHLNTAPGETLVGVGRGAAVMRRSAAPRPEGLRLAGLPTSRDGAGSESPWLGTLTARYRLRRSVNVPMRNAHLVRLEQGRLWFPGGQTSPRSAVTLTAHGGPLSEVRF
jgi:hypothetical protein